MLTDDEYDTPLFLKRTIIAFAAVSAFIWILLSPCSSWALRCFLLSPDTTLYGTARWVQVNEEDTLLDIARDFGLGYNQIIAANPAIDPWIPAKGGLVLVPSAFVLPKERTSSGIVVNLAEMRLYYFFTNGGHDYFVTAPIGIGTEGFLTQLGSYKIKSKTANPTWVAPESIRKAEPDLPAEVPPGPDNPLGDYAFRLSEMRYAIHGTNKPWGIGRRVSHGCIRMYPEDIGQLYPMVPQGTTVQVVYEPIKIGWGEGKLWVQIFEDFDNRIDNGVLKVMEELYSYETATGPLEIDFSALVKALNDKTGVPVAVAHPKNS